MRLKIHFLIPLFSLVSFLFVVSQAQADSGVKNYKKGLSFYQQGRYADALERFQQAIDDNLEFWQAYQMAGYCCFEMHRKEAALKAFEDSLELNPRNPKLTKIYNDLKNGQLELPVRPVAEASTYYVRF
ncbi:MAG TPA: tetratricopeptide repeat protein [bacterium]|nr:tetratricopeptide repeat protein [bacterium]